MGRLEPRPDRHEPGLRIMSCAKMTSVEMLKSFSAGGMINVLVREVLNEVPGADFIEIRAVKFYVAGEGNDERTTPAVPPGQ